MSVITLTTDLGTTGFYAASIKAAILKGLPDATIVDVSHSIRPFHISEAAFVIRNVYKQFADGTIHLVSVDALNSPHSRVLLIKAEGQYFIGPDNGIFSLVFDFPLVEVFEISLQPDRLSLAFPAKDIMAKAAIHIAKNGNLAEIGKPNPNYVQLTAWQPINNEASIRTTVVYIDGYGNCVFNVDKGLFERTAKGRPFSIDVKRNPIESISSSYNDVNGGELVAMFNGSGNLEIAINRGNLSELLGLKEGDSIMISFEG
jgi:S-adenosyl-L-methionine hydrolase (adenosine-forming)